MDATIGAEAQLAGFLSERQEGATPAPHRPRNPAGYACCDRGGSATTFFALPGGKVRSAHTFLKGGSATFELQ